MLHTFLLALCETLGYMRGRNNQWLDEVDKDTLIRASLYCDSFLAACGCRGKGTERWCNLLVEGDKQTWTDLFNALEDEDFEGKNAIIKRLKGLSQVKKPERRPFVPPEEWAGE